MGVSVLIYGRSGSGKSRSLKNFTEDEIFLVNVIGKPLPFPGRFQWNESEFREALWMSRPGSTGYS